MTSIAEPTRRSATLCRLSCDGRGNVAIEMALAAPVVFMLLLGIIESGRAMWLKNALDFSVAEAARCASINPTLCGTAAQIQSYAASRAGGAFTSSVFSSSTDGCGNQVSASYPLTLTIPFLALSVTLTADACYPS